MHRLVAARKGITGQVDHKDQNKLNNQRNNLRAATRSQNGANCGKQQNNTTGFKGVCWSKWAQKWQASIGVSGKVIHLGYWNSAIAAACAYNRAAHKYFGPYAVFNKV
jgi:hypothetical protein